MTPAEILKAFRDKVDREELERLASGPPKYDGGDPFLASREWAVMRMRALERDGGRCAVDGRTAKDGYVMNVDHIKPRKYYPELALTLSNLQVLCSECNHGKGNKFETDWRKPAAIQATTGTPEEQVERARQLGVVHRISEGENDAGPRCP